MSARPGKVKDFDPNSQDCNNHPGGMENMLRAGYGPKGGSQAQRRIPGSGKVPSSAPRNPYKPRG